MYGPCKRKGHVCSRIHGPSTRPVRPRPCTRPVSRCHMYTDITPPCIRRAQEVYTAVTRPCTGVHGRVDGRCGAAYGPCTRPCNVSYTRRVTCRVPVTRRPCTRPVNTSSPTAVYGPCTRSVYTTCVHDCVRAACTDVFGRVHGEYTGRVHGVYWPCTQPCTRHAYGRVHVSTCLRVQGPCAVYTAVYGPSTRPKTAVYTAVHGRVYSRVRAVSAHVHGSVRAVCTAFSAVYTGRVHCRFRPST